MDLKLLCVVNAFAIGLSTPAYAQSRAATATQPTAAPGQNTQIYNNSIIGFRYQVPYGWVDRTQEMQQSNNSGNKGEVLLAAFERPPEAPGDSVNGAVVIAAEGTGSYPDFKHTEDYLGPITELATARGFKVEGEPYAVAIGSRHFVRVDFVKALNDKVTMRQCTLVLLAKAKFISFTFIGASNDEVEELMDGLHFLPVH